MKRLWGFKLGPLQSLTHTVWLNLDRLNCHAAYPLQIHSMVDLNGSISCRVLLYLVLSFAKTCGNNYEQWSLIMGRNMKQHSTGVLIDQSLCFCCQKYVWPEQWWLHSEWDTVTVPRIMWWFTLQLEFRVKSHSIAIYRESYMVTHCMR